MRKFFLVFSIVVVSFGVGVLSYLASHNTGPIGLPTKATQTYIAIDGQGRAVVIGPLDEVKTVLRHPLIPGGIKTLNDLKAHVAKNSNLKHFYEANGFDFSCVTQQTLEQNEWSSVTYRSNKDIKWSNAPLLLLKGETVFEDCHGHVIRAQCGNLVARVRQEDVVSSYLPLSLPIETLENSEIAFNTPIPAIGTPPSLPILPVGVGGGVDYGGFYGGVGGFVSGSPVKTPEPDTGILLGVGILALGAKKYLTNS